MKKKMTDQNRIMSRKTNASRASRKDADVEPVSDIEDDFPQPKIREVADGSPDHESENSTSEDEAQEKLANNDPFVLNNDGDVMFTKANMKRALDQIENLRRDAESMRDQQDCDAEEIKELEAKLEAAKKKARTTAVKAAPALPCTSTGPVRRLDLDNSRGLYTPLTKTGNRSVNVTPEDITVVATSTTMVNSIPLLDELFEGIMQSEVALEASNCQETTLHCTIRITGIYNDVVYVRMCSMSL